MDYPRSIRYGIFFIFLLFSATIAYALTFDYLEGDLIRLIPEAADDDNDNVTLRYTAPLNDSGEWQTGYDDAGTYETTIIADDGETTTEEKVTLVVGNRNRAPKVQADDVTVEETDIVEVVPDAEDPDEDPITLRYSEPLDANGRWQTDFGDEGSYKATVTVSDGELEASQTFNVTVLRKNRPPRIVSSTPDQNQLTIDETDSIRFSITADDEETDDLDIRWLVDDKENATGKIFTYQTDYDSEGITIITVLVSDGEDEVSQEWEVTINNLNRAPALDIDDMTVDENETIDLQLPNLDEDGDPIDYAITSPLEDGVWITTFDDAGVYPVTITATDGEVTITEEIIVTVNDVDRAPEFLELADRYIFENETLYTELDAVDPDGDTVTFTVTGIEARIEDDTLLFEPTYDTVSLPDNFITRMVRRIRLDKYIYSSEMKELVTVEACGKDRCSAQEFTLTVQDVNRLPIVEPIESLYLSEGEYLEIKPNASDADGDYISFTIGEPVGKGWQTDFTSEGEYYVPVTAYDGKNGVNTTVRVVVQNTNQLPTFGELRDTSVTEGEVLSFSVVASDPDGDNITLIAEDLPEDAAFSDGVFSWTPPHITASKGETAQIIVTFSATDERILRSNDSNSTLVKKSVAIDVTDANRAPVITAFSPPETILAFVNQPVVFTANAFDPDGDELHYSWKFGTFDGVEGKEAVRRKFTSPGQKRVYLTISDGEQETEYTWFITAGRPKKSYLDSLNQTQVQVVELAATG